MIVFAVGSRSVLLLCLTLKYRLKDLFQGTNVKCQVYSKRKYDGEERMVVCCAVTYDTIRIVQAGILQKETQKYCYLCLKHVCNQISKAVSASLARMDIIQVFMEHTVFSAGESEGMRL